MKMRKPRFVMNVKDLMRKLLDLPSDALVVLACDSEGNRFSPLSDVQLGCYQPDAVAADIGDFYVEDAPKRAKAVCLWPVR